MNGSEVVYEVIEIKQEEVYDPNWNSWTASEVEPQDENKTCGEIIVSSHGKFTFICVLCTGNFDSLRSFGLHIHSKHMKLQPGFDNTGEGSLTESSCSSTAEIGSPQPDNERNIKIESSAKVHEARSTAIVPDKTPKKSNGPHNRKIKINAGTSNSKALHSSEKAYVCPYCPKIFNDPTTQETHINQHTSEGSHICTHCSKEFTTASKLYLHGISHLPMKREFTCSYCDKRFEKLHRKTMHERVHTGEKPYQCKLCAKRFISQVRLTEHTRRHKNTKNQECEFCSMVFLNLASLKRHQLIHST